MNDEYNEQAAGLKREAENPLTRTVKKPRDERLRDCFHITPLEGGREQVICRYCPDYNKTLQKFNPTKARTHLTGDGNRPGCPGVDDVLRQILLDTTQAAKKSQRQETGEVAVATAAVHGGPPAAAGGRNRKPKGRNRPSPAYLSFHSDNTSLVRILCQIALQNTRVVYIGTQPTTNSLDLCILHFPLSIYRILQLQLKMMYYFSVSHSQLIT